MLEVEVQGVPELFHDRLPAAGLPLDPLRQVAPPHAAPAGGPDAALLGAAAGGHAAALRLPGHLGDNVDHAVHRVGAPDGRAETADHHDAVHILQVHVL